MGAGTVRYAAAAKEAGSKLEAAGVPEAKENALLLLEYVCGSKRQDLYLKPDRILNDDELKALNRLIAARAERYPLQQLTGSQYFMGLEFLVDGNVLIPRQDTEILVERVLKDGAEGRTVLDLCTGSGCILISTAVLGRTKKAVGCDISRKALKVAELNAGRNGADILLYEGDLFDALPAGLKGSFDIITANPPYIRTADIEGLMPEVKDHEPLCALDGGDDGLIFYRRIAMEACEWLKAGGHIYMETGSDQAEDVSAIFAAQGYAGIEVLKDLAGLDRVVTVRR